MAHFLCVSNYLLLLTAAELACFSLRCVRARMYRCLQAHHKNPIHFDVLRPFRTAGFEAPEISPHHAILQIAVLDCRGSRGLSTPAFARVGHWDFHLSGSTKADAENVQKARLPKTQVRGLRLTIAF